MMQINGKTALHIDILLSKVDRKVYCVLDANMLDAADFGISLEKFHAISKNIEEIFKQELEKINDN